MPRFALAFTLLVSLFAGAAPTAASAQQSRPRRVDAQAQGSPAQDAQSYPDAGSYPDDDSARQPAGEPVGEPRPDAVPADGDDTLDLEGALIEVPTVVSDRSGHYVPGLGKNDFELYEDNERQQLAFVRDERVPIHVAVVMDTSSSTSESLGDIQDAAVDFVGQLLPGDEVMVVSFDGDVRVEQKFTSDRKRLTKAIKGTRTEQGTKLYDAVYYTVQDYLKKIDGRKAMVLLSDGDDTRSERSFDDAVNVCSESDVMVYGIRYPGGGGGSVMGIPMPGGSHKSKDKDKGWKIPGLPGVPRIPHIPGIKWPFAANLAPAAGPAVPDSPAALAWAGGGRGGQSPRDRSPFMEQVTANSGGAVYYANAVRDVRGLFADIAEELRHVYVLGYAPTNPVANGGYRKIDVEVPSQPDLAIRHRLGYKATA